MAGQALFGDWSIAVHGYLGNGSFALGAVVFGLALVARLGRAEVIAAGILAVALFAQVGLGYAGRTATDAAAIHVPMGVTIFGLVIFVVTVACCRPGRRHTT